MKKYLLSILSILALSGFCQAYAQDIIEETVETETVKPVANHSLSMPLAVLGFEYGYEQPLGGPFSMVFRGGFTGRVTQFAYDIQGAPGQIAYDFALIDDFAVGLTIEPRVYTSLNRRASLGRSTYCNSGDFIALKIQGSVGKPGTTLDVSVVPAYGIRRVWDEHWYGEFTAGLGVAYNSSNYGYLYLKPHLQYRIGFIF